MEKEIEVLTVQETADLLKVSKGTVERLIRSGSLKSYKLGDPNRQRVPVRISRQSVIKMLESFAS
jgi:excisionase family DNA binding protein